jgi:hypothetical protein
VPSLQQNANYRNSTVNICMYISVLQHNIRLEHVMYRARIRNKQMKMKDNKSYITKNIRTVMEQY